MPTYSFRCACGHEFDTVAKVGTEIVPCDNCQRGAKRQFSVARPDQFRHWPERFAVTRSQVAERYVRSKWSGFAAARSSEQAAPPARTSCSERSEAPSSAQRSEQAKPPSRAKRAEP